MTKLLLMCVSLLILQGCQTTSDVNDADNQKMAEQKSAVEESRMPRKGDEEFLYYYISHSFSQADIEQEAVREKSGMRSEANGYGKLYAFNGEKSLILSEVVSKMADQLLFNFPHKYHSESIALTSIVDLNDHTVTNWLGQTVSEQFIHELHIRKLSVIDFKLTGNIQLTNAGEFALTRDWTKLNKNVNVSRILTGTMSRNEEGVIFNMRIVNASSNLVEATSSAFVPHNLFVGGQYDYQDKKYYERDSRFAQKNGGLVRIVK